MYKYMYTYMYTFMCSVRLKWPWTCKNRGEAGRGRSSRKGITLAKVRYEIEVGKFSWSTRFSIGLLEVELEVAELFNRFCGAFSIN